MAQMFKDTASPRADAIVVIVCRVSAGCLKKLRNADFTLNRLNGTLTSSPEKDDQPGRFLEVNRPVLIASLGVSLKTLNEEKTTVNIVRVAQQAIPLTGSQGRYTKRISGKSRGPIRPVAKT